MNKKERKIVKKAIAILDSHLKESGEILLKPQHTVDYLRLQLENLEHEVFVAVFLDNRHRVISCDHMFRGTIDGASVHTREVVKAALLYNAAALIFAHNHPAGIAEPSVADERITARLRNALSLVDIRVLDHIVIGKGQHVSFAERGMI